MLNNSYFPVSGVRLLALLVMLGFGGSRSLSLAQQLTGFTFSVGSYVGYAALGQL